MLGCYPIWFEKFYNMLTVGLEEEVEAAEKSHLKLADAMQLTMEKFESLDLQNHVAIFLSSVTYANKKMLYIRAKTK